MRWQDKPNRSVKDATRLIEPDSALASYLDALLSEIEVSDDGEELLRTKVDNSTADIQQQQSRQPAPTSHHTSSRVTETEVVVDAAVRRTESLVPEWAQAPFQALLVRISGLTLGVPLTALLGILKWTGRANELPGQPAWQLGLVISRGRKILVVDTACLIMPERLSTQLRDGRQSGGFLLLVGNGGWGLAVDALDTIVRMEQHQVRWRSAAGGRPWLAGTMIEQLSVLLDVDGLIGMFDP